MPKQNHGGRRSGSGRPPLPPEKKMRRRSVGMLDSDWDKVKAMAEAEKVSEDEIIRRLVRAAEVKPQQVKRRFVRITGDY